MATKRTAVSGILLDESTELSLGEVCRACSMHAEWVVTLVEEGIIEPAGGDQRSWRFTGMQLRHLRTISRLQRDLGVNLAGAALALELLEEVEALRARLAALEPPR
jgi:chaperone modulatory protein CbpM